MTGGRGLVPLGFLLFGVLAALGVQLHDAQDESQRAAVHRFEQRAQISAALTQSMFGALGSASAAELGRQFGGPAAGLKAKLAPLIKRGGLAYAALRDDRGAVIARVGRVGPLGAENRSGRALSNIRHTPAGAVLEYELPIATPNGKRVFVEGIPATFMRSFLGTYLKRLPNPDGTTLVVADGRGAVLARIAPQGVSAPTQDPITVATQVPGTPWRLSLVAERARVLAGSGGQAWVGWLMLVGLALAILAGLLLCARVIASSRRISGSNRALRESESKLRALVGALEEAVFLQYADGSIELLNASAKALAENDADVVMEPRTDWLPVSDDGLPLPPEDTPVGRSFAHGTSESRVMGLDRPGHERVWLDVSTRPLTHPGETTPYAVVCSCTDVTERQNLEAHLLDLADRDPLTGLWNRRRFEQDLSHQLARCRRYDERAALVLMDIDDFKRVNDERGHLAGDELLCDLSEALSSRLRSTDRAARLGGDEFAVLLLDLDLDDTDAESLASDLVGHMRDAAAAHDHTALSISVGTAVLGRSTGGVNEALEQADRAMYAVKQHRSGAPAAPERALRPVVKSTAEMASLRALLAAVNARDSYTAMHSREVVTLARGVARCLDLDDAETSEVEHIDLLHDLGKIAVPDAILRKAGPLTDHEWLLMRQHPVVGADILASMPELAHLSPAVRGEHERWDGGGYPDGLAGEQIPIASRITLVCDAYHAMTSNRPYRRAMSARAAREEIHREAGAQFCPHASAALLDVLTATHEHQEAV
jgi:diguanylate cyclase (GGDEF)-like protein